MLLKVILVENGNEAEYSNTEAPIGRVTTSEALRANRPLESIDWSSHVPLIGRANAALARYDGMPRARQRCSRFTIQEGSPLVSKVPRRA